MPMSSSAVVNRADMLALVSELEAGLETALAQSEQVVAAGNAVLEDARREAERIVADARSERDRLVSDTDVFRLAKREADDLLATARRESQELRAETDDYVDSRLANFEVTLHKTLEAVTRGRERLQGRTTFHALGSPEPEEGSPEHVAGRSAGADEAAVDAQPSPELQTDEPGPATPAAGETRLNPSGA
jgi:hypothetical protein